MLIKSQYDEEVCSLFYWVSIQSLTSSLSHAINEITNRSATGVNGCRKPGSPVWACFCTVAGVHCVRKHKQGKSKGAVRAGMISSLRDTR